MSDAEATVRTEQNGRSKQPQPSSWNVDSLTAWDARTLQVRPALTKRCSCARQLAAAVPRALGVGPLCGGQPSPL